MSGTKPTAALGWDFKQQSAFVAYFNNLSEATSSTLRFFNHSDFYTVHGSDTSRTSNFTGNIIQQMGEDPKLPYVILRKPQFEQFARDLLLVKQYRVEVYSKTAPNRTGEWTLEYKGSPGHLTQFEEILFDGAAINFSNYVMAVRIGTKHDIAVACINSTELKFQVCELTDNECFTELEALVAQIGPRECLIPQGDSPDLVALRKVLERNGVLLAPVKRTEFDSILLCQDLNRLLFFHEGQQRDAVCFEETKLSEAMTCLSAGIKFLGLTGDQQNFNQFKMTTIEVNRYVRLDNAALYSLNILPRPDSKTVGNHGKSFSVKGVLDCCITSQGRRLLEQWIKQPLKEINLLNERLDIVQCFVKDPEVRQGLRSEALTRLPDLLLLSKKLTGKKAKLRDCYQIYQIVGAVPTLLELLRQTRNAHVLAALVNPIEDIVGDLKKFQDMVEEVLDLSLVDRGEFLVNKDFDPELGDIYERKRKSEEKMQRLQRSAMEDLGLQTIKMDCNDQHGYFFRVTLKEEPALRKASRYKILDAIKGGVRFTNDKLLELNEKYNEAKEAYEEKQKIVIAEIFEVAAGYGDTLRNLNIYLATVDVLASFAHASVSASIPYVRPIIHEIGTNILKLTKARHPCLEQQDGISFIPNNVEFNANTSLHIITGPNMCGKSTFIRTVGVCVLMAQIGCFVPCEYAEMSLVDAVFSRVGSEDCQMKGLSTFMLEMLETATITKSATSNSLVIIDELGRGTSTYDGCGIAFALAEFLAKEIKCFSLFATHFHEITRLSQMYETVKNLHVTAVTTENTITPLFQIRQGECDKSYGIHCARMAEFPDDVIKAAIEYQKELEHSAGTQLIKDYEPVLKRTIIKDGDKLIEEVLSKARKLNVDQLSKEDLLKEMQQIKLELLSSENLFVKGLLQDS